MSNFAEQDRLIRQFLLGILSEEQSLEVEARIFAEPEFGEEVEIVEEELMSDYAAGRLSQETCLLFEQKYKRIPANRNELEYQMIFNEFICSKPAAMHAAAAAEPLSPVAATPSAPDTSGIQPVITRRASGKSWFPAFILRPATLGIACGLFLLFLLIVLWSRFLLGPTEIDSDLAATRPAIEQRLQSLNATTAFRSSYKLLPIDLSPIERGDGQIARIALPSDETNRLIEFHLNVAHEGSERYRVLFLDDKRNELFAINDLVGMMTPNGRQVQFFVPSEYLKSGDYQIELSFANERFANESGVRRIVNSYAFRMVEMN